jgi:hypothetical protein
MLVLAILAVTPLSLAVAQNATATFRTHLYENPQPSESIFAQTWPDLIDANNKALATFLHMKPAPGKNLDLYLDNAELPIAGGKIVASIDTSSFDACHTGPLSQDETPRAFSCPARLTVYKDGQARTKDIGFICRVGSTSPMDAAHMTFDAETNSLRFWAVIAGKMVRVSNTDEPCDRTLSLAE